MTNLIYNQQFWVKTTDPDYLKELLSKMLLDCGYRVVGFVEHYFEPEGYTALWLLAESHLAVHTFPEKETAYIELSGCNAEKNNFFAFLLNKHENLFNNQAAHGLETETD